MALETVKSVDVVQLGEDFELHIGAYELRRSGRRLKLERIPMELLLLLVEQRGQLVSREQIVERIWGKDVYLGTDGSINAAVRKLRQALKDDPDQPRFVQTISGKGYRFIASVAEIQASVEDQTIAPAPLSSENLPSVPVSNPGILRWLSARPGLAIFGIIALLIVAVSTFVVRFGSRASPSAASGRFMLAVMPFDNLTGDSGQDYFSDGLTEEMISQLGNIDPQHLGVIARTSVMYYKNRSQPLPQVGRDLGVQYVLEGSVRRDSGKVRINAQLIQVQDQSRLWARQYDRELSDLLNLQGEIAHEIALEIRLTLGEGHGLETSTSRPAPVPQRYEAYDLYLKGQYLWNKRTTQSLQQAIDYFQQAIAKDPTYARAYSGLADSYALISGYNSSVPAKDVMPKARAAALRAIELDASSAEAHTALAVIAQNYDWDWSTAEREYRRAIQLNPNYATAHHWYGEFLGLQGRFDESFHEFERARQLDPLSLIIAADHAAILFYARQHDGSIAQFRAVLEMEPNFPRAYNILGPYAEKGMYAEGFAQMDRWEKSPGDHSWLPAWRAYFYGRTGDHNRARHALQQLKELNQRQHLDSSLLALAYIGLGDKPRALLSLEKASADHSTALTSIKVNPVFDSLRSEPRFQELLRRVGLAN